MNSNLNFFDSSYYLTAYPDIKASGVDPLKHYLKFGRFEGRSPCELVSTKLEKLLWQRESTALEQLVTYSTEESVSPVEALFANWYLARFFAYRVEWPQACAYLVAFWRSPLTDIVFPHDGPLCLTAMCLKHEDSVELTDVLQRRSFSNPYHQHMASIMFAEKARRHDLIEQWSQLLGESYASLSPSCFDDLGKYQSKRKLSHRHKVSIIVPCYNAGKTVVTSLTSLKRQSWQNLEVIIVDDASTDGSIGVIESTIKGDKRFKLVALKENKGAYYARNEGASYASGHFITAMDADDWAHPHKVELQVKALLKNPLKKASISHWARTTEDLTFTHWRIENGWIEPNLSSLMVKRSVLEKIGYWDEVRAGADTEYHHRLIAKFGRKSVVTVAPARPLSFGRVRADSLTLTGDTHISTYIQGTRADYHFSFERWHTESKKRSLFLPLHTNSRKFSAPKALLVADEPVFDAQWYADAYGDVAKAGVGMLKHYKMYGQEEGREPSAHYSVSAQRLLANKNFENLSSSVLPIFKGSRIYQENLPTWVFFGHAAGTALFGAERCLLDILQSIVNVQKNIIVVLPSAENLSYIRDILNLSSCVHILPTPWWRADRGLNMAVKSNIEALIKRYSSEFCYVNTLTLWEAVIAANACEVPVALQIRELPEHDKALCKHLHATPTAITHHLNSLCCELWVNSDVTRKWAFSLGIEQERIQLLYDGIDASAFFELTVERHVKIDESPVVVGMLSSNLLKKGISDFYKVQNLLNNSNVQFKLFGPHTKNVKTKHKENYQYMGYVDDPAEAIGQCDIILCLSHCQESFGRTAVEAMAAGRTVIAYDWGALTEVIGDAGILVRLKDTHAVKAQIKALEADRSRLKFYATKARARANDFSLEALGNTFQVLADKAIANFKTKTH